MLPNINITQYRGEVLICNLIWANLSLLWVHWGWFADPLHYKLNSSFVHFIKSVRKSWHGSDPSPFLTMPWFWRRLMENFSQQTLSGTASSWHGCEAISISCAFKTHFQIWFLSDYNDNLICNLIWLLILPTKCGWTRLTLLQSKIEFKFWIPLLCQKCERQISLQLKVRPGKSHCCVIEIAGSGLQFVFVLYT